MAAIIAGKMARNPKNATPAPMIGMLSALFSAHARLTICFQPLAGICVGFSACTPGSSDSLGTSGAGRAASRRSVATMVDLVAPSWGSGSVDLSSAARAAARRAAFSATRSWIRSTALCGRWVSGIVLVLVSRWWLWGWRSVAGPGAGQLREAAGTAPAHQRLDDGDDRAAEGGGDQDLAQP